MNSCPEYLKDRVQLISDETDFMKRQIVLLPAFLAKGLELIAFFYGASMIQKVATDQDQLVFYTMCTRAMHELVLVTSESESPLIESMDPALYTTINI